MIPVAGIERRVGCRRLVLYAGTVYALVVLVLFFIYEWQFHSPHIVT
eukprot:COSAG02_NODE_2053_length_9994_cov_7.402628_10_plen_47_part_00